MAWRDVLPVHPAADLFPTLSPDELKALGEDIKRNGLQTPIIVVRSLDSDKLMLLDGRNRLDAAGAAGILRITDGVIEIQWPDGEFDKVPRQCREDTDDLHALVMSLNLYRRHLTAEQKREVIAKIIKADPSKSNRKIAEIAKADHKTVGTVRTEIERTGEIRQFDKTVGKDGKSRKKLARKPKPPPPKPPAEPSQDSQDTAPPPAELLPPSEPAAPASPVDLYADFVNFGQDIDSSHARLMALAGQAIEALPSIIFASSDPNSSKVAEAKDQIAELKAIRVEGMALSQYGLFADKPDTYKICVRVREYAARKVGMFLVAMEQAEILRPEKHASGSRIGTATGQLSPQYFGVEKNESAVWKRLARMTDAEFEEHIVAGPHTRRRKEGAPEPDPDQDEGTQDGVPRVPDQSKSEAQPETAE